MPSETDRELVQRWWKDAWSEGLWAASWAKSLEGLTAAQAAWSPVSAPSAAGVGGGGGAAGKRHSIWQNVLHMVFWREDALARLTGAPKPTADQLARLNFPAITDASEGAWAEARRRFAESQSRIGAALADGSLSMDRLKYMLPHDCYHFGQINLIRAMLGLPPIE